MKRPSPIRNICIKVVFLCYHGIPQLCSSVWHGYDISKAGLYLKYLVLHHIYEIKTCEPKQKYCLILIHGFMFLTEPQVEYCSAWPRLKLNTKIGLHTTTTTTTHHHPPPHKLLGSNISAVTVLIWIKL